MGEMSRSAALPHGADIIACKFELAGGDSIMFGDEGAHCDESKHTAEFSSVTVHMLLAWGDQRSLHGGLW